LLSLDTWPCSVDTYQAACPENIASNFDLDQIFWRQQAFTFIQLEVVRREGFVMKKKSLIFSVATAKNFVFAAALSCGTLGTVALANAAVFDVSGSSTLPLGGTLTIDTTTGGVTGQDVTVPNPPNVGGVTFTGLTSSVSSGAGADWNITVESPPIPPVGEIYYVLMVLPVSSLVGYAGGNVSIAVLYDNVTGFEGQFASCGVPNGGACGSLTLETTPPSGTPLPAALPLFATGLGAMGLLGWRRKRRNAAALAAT
jgi:hypothetical protein